MKEAVKQKKEDLKNIKPEVKQKMVEYLRVMLSDDLKYSIKNRINKDPSGWATAANITNGIPMPFHFREGMGIRNLLRSGGFTEDKIGIANLDNVYVEITEEAIINE